MIDREMIVEMFVEMFDGMRSNGAWNVDGPLLWGYFFTGYDKEKLEEAAAELVSEGYRFVDKWQATPEDSDDTELWWLHVERVEHHTVDSLFARNTALYALADRHELESYDGMDVGAVDH